ncbi:Ribonuclease H domain [Macleaya cordata]|uniref:Ribonuclease H domain n=1 Tax=Macleaya cordata TaxID=56857 RepID=A0A200QXW3_MACCD|nr:Ribonuclease H domain [Macleaya cordata]
MNPCSSVAPPESRGAPPNNPTPPISFANVLAPPQPTKTPVWVPEYRLSMKDGIPAIKFSPHDMLRSEQKLAHALILKFSAGRPSINDIKSHIDLHWGLSGTIVVGIIDPRHILLNLSSEADVLKALVREKKNIKGYWFRLFRWSSSFDPRKDSSIAAVWVLFPRLPIKFFSNELLMGVADCIGGRFLKADNPTIGLSRPSTARICVELDLAKSIPDSIWIWTDKDVGFEQDLVFENKPKFCDRCSLQGHDFEECRKYNKKKLAVPVEAWSDLATGVGVAENGKAHVDNSSGSGMIKESDQDGFQQVKSKNAWRKKKHVTFHGESSDGNMGVSISADVNATARGRSEKSPGNKEPLVIDVARDVLAASISLASTAVKDTQVSALACADSPPSAATVAASCTVNVPVKVAGRKVVDITSSEVTGEACKHADQVRADGVDFSNISVVNKDGSLNKLMEKLDQLPTEVQLQSVTVVEGEVQVTQAGDELVGDHASSFSECMGDKIINSVLSPHVSNNKKCADLISLEANNEVAHFPPTDRIMEVLHSVSEVSDVGNNLSTFEKESAIVNSNLDHLTDNVCGMGHPVDSRILRYEGEDHSDSGKSADNDDGQSIEERALVVYGSDLNINEISKNKKKCDNRRARKNLKAPIGKGAPRTRSSSIRHLRLLIKENKINLVMLSEPMIHHDRLIKVATSLSLSNYAHNSGCGGKIWILWGEAYSVTVISSSAQYIHTKIVYNPLGMAFFASFVYASCDGYERRALWADLSAIGTGISAPWILGGDFNVVSNLAERLGGRPAMGSNIEDFNEFVESNELVDGGYVGSKYTWCNNQQGTRRIWARLDRVLINSLWVRSFPPISVHHKARICSDHSPLVVMLHNHSRRGPTPFRFQRMWVTHIAYENFLKEHWNSEVHGSPMQVLATKLKIFRLKLKTWNAQVFGNVNQNLHILEDKILAAEASLEQEKIASFHTPRRCTQVTHLLYADDTIIFLNGRESSLQGCMEFLEKYSACSGQKINVEKSSFMMHSSSPSTLVNSISQTTGYQRKTAVMMYLGAPICAGRMKVIYFDGLLSKFRNKLAGWKANFLSQGGKLIMIRHVLASMAIYLLSAVVTPKLVLQSINRIISTFFWGSQDGKPKRKWVSWKTICKPVSEGRLGIRGIEEVVGSFRLKSLWNGLENKSIWASFICGKYNINRVSLPVYVPPPNASKFWKECASLIPLIVKNSVWKVGQGDMNFWLENWSNEGILAEAYTGTEVPSTISLKEVVDADFIISGINDPPISLLRRLFESRLMADSDMRLWAPTTNGSFTVKSAFDQIRDVASVCPFASFYWANFIPIKLSVFFWRALQNAVPVDTRIQNCMVSLASACVCCTQRQIETFNHLFLQGKIAADLWDHFGSYFGIHRVDFIDFKDLIWAWFNVAPPGSKMGCLAALIPMVIMWETWLERNRRLHNGPPASFISTRLKVLKWIHDLNPRLIVKKRSPATFKNFLSACNISPTQVRRKPIKILRWSTPPPGYFILNTDGASVSRIAAGGGVIRDSQGEIVAAFHSSYGMGTNNLAESRALLDGLALCRQMDIRNIAVRVDSHLVASWFHAKGEIPWSLQRWWHRIRELSQNLNLFVAHVYRELNAPADSMASMGLTSNTDRIFLSDFPARLVGLARLDRLGFLIFGMDSS